MRILINVNSSITHYYLKLFPRKTLKYRLMQALIVYRLIDAALIIFPHDPFFKRNFDFTVTIVGSNGLF